MLGISGLLMGCAGDAYLFRETDLWVDGNGAGARRAGHLDWWTGGEGMSLDELNSGLGLWTRPRLLQVGAASAVTLSAVDLAKAAETTARHSMMEVKFEKREPRVAMIGAGGRGTSLLALLLAADAQVVALCDIVKEKAEPAAGMVTAAGQKAPDLFTDGPHHYEALCARKDIDLVLVATPWNW